MKKIFSLLLPIIVVGLVCLAWMNRFVQDDAFISFRYAENLVRGHGLVWNPGERVEGYTNFLWTVLLAGVLSLGIDPVPASQVLGLVCFLITLLVSERLAALLFASLVPRLLLLVLLGINYTFSAYATGGLETQLQTCLFVSILYVFLLCHDRAQWPPATLGGLSLLASAAALTRLDSVLVILPVVALAGVFLVAAPGTLPWKAAQAAALCVPLVLVVGGWFAWKLAYYGDILPNTFYVKAAGSTSLKAGLDYLYLFFFSYWLIPWIGLGAVALIRRRVPFAVAVLGGCVLVWSLYIVKVGGDFMEFRFLVPVLPLVFVLITWTLFALVEQAEVRWVLVALIVLGSFHHALTFGRYTHSHDIEGIRELAAHLDDKNENWTGIGRRLGAMFAGAPDVVIATTAAGAIPYYARLPTVDMLGLNDHWIARHGAVVGNRPGHQKKATFRYLLARRVNLVLNHPWLRLAKEGRSTGYSAGEISRHFVRLAPGDRLPPEAAVVEIPISPGRRLAALYLTPSPAVEAAIRAHGWSRYPVAR
jgi:arabinofuranosyltransferase